MIFKHSKKLEFRCVIVEETGMNEQANSENGEFDERCTRFAFLIRFLIYIVDAFT